MKSFSLLKPEIKEVLSELGFKRPTDIQEAAIPEILKNRNVLLIAPTGIGKTEAALLPIFDRFLEDRRKGISILYITPLRALNRDLLERMEWWSQKLNIKIAVRHGDTSQHMRRKQALAPPDMLITTPETLQAILPGRVMKEHLKNICFVVVDEIHELAEDKRGAQLSIGLERLDELASRFQRIGLSATIGSPELVSKFLAGEREIKILRISATKETELNVEKPMPKKEDRAIAEKIFAGLDASSRLRRIAELLSSHSSALIFVNTREMAEILASRFRILGESAGIHHSSLSQEVRIAAERDFKTQKLKALICTSSLELGIDVGSIDIVMQYKSPRQVTRLLQRIGRSGHRIGRKSKGVVIATDADDILEAMVIAREACDEKLEEVELNEKPYDVLAHQLVGIALDFGRISKSKAFEIIKRSFVFSSLMQEEFERVLNLLNSLGLLWLDGENFGKAKKSWKYYFENLSTIPDERRYFVRNIITQENVGILDEAFVVNYVESGNLIIFKGAPWRVVSLDEREILVEPVDEVTGAIPSWAGEEIPVPFDVAGEVGRLRGEIAVQGLRALNDYPADEYTKKLATSKIKRHIKKSIPVPDDKHIVVELFQNFAVVHSCYGTKVNQTIGRTFSTLLTAQLGTSVALSCDAYRIILHSPRSLSQEQMRELFKIDFELIEPLLSKSLKRASLFKWKFVHVAKRFGAIAKDVSYQSKIAKVIDAYEGSPIFEEVLKEIFKDNLDLKNTKRVFEGIKNKEIKVEFVRLDRPSPLAELGLKAYAEIVLPERAERMILKALKKRIVDRRIELFCLHCTKWSSSFRVKNLQELRCKNCGAGMLAVLKGRYKEMESVYRRFRAREALSISEKQEVKKMQASANLVLSYGKSAVVAQAARGVGPEVAKRVLIASRNEEELYKKILKAERDYARTKKFWD
ncbi:MAG: DEAD/DEAH box helicase [Euryarchaeota archaeon]|nr:DEAD/DEAH box helicase [Euryarchaeota archaeon]